MNTKSFLGTGWSFPVRFDQTNCTVHMSSEVRDIEESLTILLNTRPGERVMRPDYGCALDDMLFEPVDAGIITYVKDLISNAILYYEPRVNLQNIEIITDPDMILEGRILIELDLVVRNTNSRFNYVYDFYKREASIQPQL
ncbi:MAG: GPW/gp25 family protein [Saprospiraceae bacterium]|jgi:phage baseplate assembly protein W|nr:GPW/gp25 family protein [Lewinellaceae bacterium]